MIPTLDEKNFSDICQSLPLRNFNDNLPLLFYVMVFFDTNKTVQDIRFNPDMIIYYLDMENQELVSLFKNLSCGIEISHVSFIIKWLEYFCENKKMQMFHIDAQRVFSNWKHWGKEYHVINPRT